MPSIGSWLTYKIGRPLVRVNFDLERYNADFRYRMTRIRENAESIALYKGEPDEERRLGGAFGRIYATWWQYMNSDQAADLADRILRPGRRHLPVPGRRPRATSPARFTLGVRHADRQRLRAGAGLAVLVRQQLRHAGADWKATVDRLTTFADAMAAAKRAAQATERGFDVATGAQPALELDDVEVALPNGRVLLEDVDLVDRARASGW